MRRRRHQPPFLVCKNPHSQVLQRDFDFVAVEGGTEQSCRCGHDAARLPGASAAHLNPAPRARDPPCRRQSRAAAASRARWRAPGPPGPRRARSAGPHPSPGPSAGRARHCRGGEVGRLEEDVAGVGRAGAVRSPPMMPAMPTGPAWSVITSTSSVNSISLPSSRVTFSPGCAKRTSMPPTSLARS